MKTIDNVVRLAATDLSNHLACRHLTALDLAVARGTREPARWNSPDAWVLQQRGLAHESAFLDHLRAQDVSFVDLRDSRDEAESAVLTLKAMSDGVDVIAQATVAHGRWFGRADVLRRVEVESRLGNWSYEAYDCKLARETKVCWFSVKWRTSGPR